MNNHQLTHNEATRSLRTYVEINTAAYAHNLARIREMTPTAKVMAVIKANAYGHDMECAARHLMGSDEFAVTDMNDVRFLHGHGIVKPTTLLSAKFNSIDLEWLSQHQSRPVIYDYEQLRALRSLPSDCELDVWLKVDTGMGRLGFSCDEITSVFSKVSQYDGIGSISLMTHLANADQPHISANKTQFERLAAVLEVAEKHGHSYTEISVLNSAGVVAFAPRAEDIVRPGILLYGISPQPGLSAHKLGLKPVMEFKSTVISVRRMPAGSGIGYGGAYTLDADSRVAYVACGYGDGYPRHAPSGTNVLINGFLMPLIGRVSMDMLAVDVGEMPVNVGDTATLWGQDNPIEDIALASGTIAYELTCGITSRVTRIHL